MAYNIISYIIIIIHIYICISSFIYHIISHHWMHPINGFLPEINSKSLRATRLLVCRIDEGHRPKAKAWSWAGFGGFFTGSCYGKPWKILCRVYTHILYTSCIYIYVYDISYKLYNYTWTPWKLQRTSQPMILMPLKILWNHRCQLSPNHRPNRMDSSASALGRRPAIRSWNWFRMCSKMWGFTI